MKDGSILHCYSDGFLARAIRRFTRSRVNHTALVIEVWGETFIIDAQRDGVNLRPLKEWQKKYNYNYIISEPKTFTKEQKQLAISMVGHTPYDFASLLWYQPLYILFGKWYGKRKGDAKNRMFCSEFVAWVYELENWWKLSPQEVKEKIKKHKNFI